MQLQDLIEQYGSMKKSANKLYSEYKNMQVELAKVREELQAKLSETGLKSAKGQHFGVTTVTKPNIIVSNEFTVLQWLKEAPEIETDAYIGLKTTNFKKLALEMLKNTGEIIPGIEVQMAETLAIRENKKG